MIIDTDSMRMSKEIFETLKSGTHISTDNGTGQLWHAYNERPDEWEALFAMLGYVLNRHESGFCFLETTNTTTSNAAQVTVFILALIRIVATETENIENGILTGSWQIDALPQLRDERGKNIMKQVDVTDAAGLKEVARKIAKLGFASIDDKGEMRFHKPVRRFLTMCIDAHAQSAEKEALAAREKAGAATQITENGQ